MNNYEYDMYYWLSVIANVTQLINYEANLKEISNDSIMQHLLMQDEILDEQTNIYLRKISKQNELIYNLLLRKECNKMNLSSICKEDLEVMVNDMLAELKTHEPQVYKKYNDLIEDAIYGIDEYEARSIVNEFKPSGEAFSMDKIKEILHKYGVSEEMCIDYYLVMNMMYNDYKTYAESKRLDIQDFCIEMSKLFINDIDSPTHKVAKYFRMFIDED